ncbi:MAG: Zn-dependent protease with chaperone function [Crocinitomicaceae bacterium]|jgi:Zn-dependent protease with chaperone function
MKNLILIFIALTIQLSLAQTDFNNYQPLESKGRIPEDFYVSSADKVQLTENQKESGLNDFQHSDFIIGTRYAIDELLHSGHVTYGDAVSRYIQEVANRLLGNYPELRMKLRFYTLKISTPNAFSTDQGIVFVTTGLISQLENEAQLAFVLAHEIAHYTENHVINSFRWSKEKHQDDSWIGEMSQYSRDHEYEADELALTMFSKARYDPKEIYNGFNILARSHNHFGNTPLNKEFYLDAPHEFPENFFHNENFSLSEYMEEEDSLSTHPNILNRKESIKKHIADNKYKWYKVKQFLSVERFKEIKTISAFEVSRYYLLQGDYIKALYASNVLQQKYPESVFLERLKLKSWLGIYQLSETDQLNTFLKSKDTSGYITNVYNSLSVLSTEQIHFLTLRKVYDGNKKLNDIESNAIYSSLIRFMCENSRGYNELNTVDQIDDSLQSPDSTSLLFPSSFQTKIILADVLMDSAFINKCEAIENNLAKNTPRYGDIFDGELNADNDYSNLALGVNSLIVVSPRGFSVYSEGVDLFRSERHERKFIKAIENGAEQSGTNIHMVLSNVNSEDGTTLFNEQMYLSSFFHQLGNWEKFAPFPVDYAYQMKIGQQNNAKNVMFGLLEHNYSSKIRVGILLAAAWFQLPFPFVASTYIPIQILKGNDMIISVAIYNIEKGRFMKTGVFRFNESVSTHGVGSHMYRIFNNIQN